MSTTRTGLPLSLDGENFDCLGIIAAGTSTMLTTSFIRRLLYEAKESSIAVERPQC